MHAKQGKYSQEHVASRFEVPGGIACHEDGNDQHAQRNAPHKYCLCLVCASPVFVSMASNACSLQTLAAGAKWPSKPESLGNHGVGSPSIAAEMLPMVTDMFIQCRKVRSLAADTRGSQT